MRARRELSQVFDREPKVEELAAKVDLPVERVDEIMRISQQPVSLETPIGEDAENELGDLIPDIFRAGAGGRCCAGLDAGPGGPGAQPSVQQGTAGARTPFRVDRRPPADS